MTVFSFFPEQSFYVIHILLVCDIDLWLVLLLQGVPCPSMPRHNKPKRVDLFYSSWCIRAGNRQFGANS